MTDDDPTHTHFNNRYFSQQIYMYVVFKFQSQYSSVSQCPFISSNFLHTYTNSFFLQGFGVRTRQNSRIRKYLTKKVKCNEKSKGKMLHQSAQTWKYRCIWWEFVIQSIWTKKTHNFLRIYSTNFQHSHGSQAEKQITETQGNQNFFSPQVNPSHSSNENSWQWRNVLRNLTTMISSQGKKTTTLLPVKKSLFSSTMYRTLCSCVPVNGFCRGIPLYVALEDCACIDFA